MHTHLPHPILHLVWRQSCFYQSKHEMGHGDHRCEPLQVFHHAHHGHYAPQGQGRGTGARTLCQQACQCPRDRTHAPVRAYRREPYLARVRWHKESMALFLGVVGSSNCESLAQRDAMWAKVEATDMVPNPAPTGAGHVGPVKTSASNRSANGVPAWVPHAEHNASSSRSAPRRLESTPPPSTASAGPHQPP